MTWRHDWRVTDGVPKCFDCGILRTDENGFAKTCTGPKDNKKTGRPKFQEFLNEPSPPLPRGKRK